MIKSTGTETKIKWEGRVFVNAAGRSELNSRILATYNNQPPYKAEELLGATALPEKTRQPSLSSKNPNRVRCPLCRRINTVEIVSQDSPGHGKAVSKYQCTYDGCRGLEFDL